MTEFTVKALVELVKDLPGCSHGDIINRFSGVSGDCCMVLRCNVEVMHGLSEDAVAVLADAQQSGLIHMHLTHFMVYLADGAPYPRNMPMAKNPPKAGYKKPRWAPVTLYSGSACSSGPCPGLMRAKR